MFKDRAAGTLTLGVCLVAGGVLFLLSAIGNILPYSFILRVWPAVLILLGIEVLLVWASNKTEKLKFSGVSVFLLILLTLFSLCIGALGFAIENSEQLLELLRGW